MSQTSSQTSTKPKPDCEREASLESQNAALKHGLRLYRDGHDDAGATAEFLLANASPAALALDAYQKQQALLVDMLQEFLAVPDQTDTSGLEREMERLLRMRGMGSRPPLRDRRGTPRRR